MFEVWFAMDGTHSLVSVETSVEEAEAVAAKMNDAAPVGEFYCMEWFDWDPSMDPACELI